MNSWNRDSHDHDHRSQELIRDGRFRWATAIVLAFLISALVAGGYYQRDLVKQQRAAQAVEQERWYAQDSKNPHSAAHYGLYPFKPRLVPAFLDPGVEPHTGIAVWPAPSASSGSQGRTSSGC